MAESVFKGLSKHLICTNKPVLELLVGIRGIDKPKQIHLDSYQDVRGTLEGIEGEGWVKMYPNWSNWKKFWGEDVNIKLLRDHLDKYFSEEAFGIPVNYTGTHRIYSLDSFERHDVRFKVHPRTPADSVYLLDNGLSFSYIINGKTLYRTKDISNGLNGNGNGAKN